MMALLLALIFSEYGQHSGCADGIPSNLSQGGDVALGGARLVYPMHLQGEDAGSVCPDNVNPARGQRQEYQERYRPTEREGLA